MKLNKRFFLLISVLLIISQSGQGQTLEQYFAIAAENNPEVQAAFRDYQAALERVPQAKSLPDPVFNLGFYILPVHTRVGNRLLDLGARQNFPWFGTLETRGNIAALEAKAELEEFEAVKNDLLFEVAFEWIELLALKEEVEVLSRQLDILRTDEELAEVQVEAGGGLEDALLAQIEARQVETLLDNARIREGALRKRFNLLLNRKKDDYVEIADSLESIDLQLTYAALYDSIIAQNPRIDALEYEAEAAEKRVKLARLESLPEFGVGVTYGYVSQRSDMEVSNNGRDILMPMASVTIPLYRKKYKAMINENKLLREKTDLQKDAVANNLGLMFEDSYEEYLSAQNNIRLYTALIGKTNQVLDLLTIAYQTGEQDFQDLLQERERVLQYQLQLLQSLRQNNIAVRRIQKMLSNYTID